MCFLIMFIRFGRFYFLFFLSIKTIISIKFQVLYVVWNTLPLLCFVLLMKAYLNFWSLFLYPHSHSSLQSYFFSHSFVFPLDIKTVFIIMGFTLFLAVLIFSYFLDYISSHYYIFCFDTFISNMEIPLKRINFGFLLSNR